MSWTDRPHLLGLCALAVAVPLVCGPRQAWAGKQPETRPGAKADKAESAAELPRQAQQATREGDALYGKAEYAKALPKYEAALAAYRKLHDGRDHPDLATGLKSLGACMSDLGRQPEALKLLEAALAMRRRIYKDDHPDLADALIYLGICLRHLGRPTQALSKHNAALRMCQRIHKGQDNSHTASALDEVALCLDHLGRSGEALPKHEAALAMRRRLSKGQDHPDVAESLNNVASCLHALSRPGEALPMYQRALAMIQQIHKDQDHPAVALGLNNVAASLKDLGRPAEALPKCREALAMTQRLYRDQDHPHVAKCLNGLAVCLNDLGRLDEALQNYRLALAMAKRLDSPDTFLWASNLGKVYLDDLAQPAEAAAAFEEAIAGMERARLRLGGDDLDRIRYFAHLRRCEAFEGMIKAQLQLKRPDRALEYAERGRALGLCDVLGRGERMMGGHVLAEVEAAAAARGDQTLRRAVAQARRQERQARNRAATLTAQISLMQGRKDLAAEERAVQIRALNAKLAAAREAHLAARRAVFNLASEHTSRDRRPLSANQVQALLSPRQRLLIYTVTRKGAMVLLVPPTGQNVRGAHLRWPDGKAADEATLGKAAARYVSGMMLEGKLARGVRREATSKHSPREHAALGHRLHQALVPAELWQELKSAELLYVVPDGILHRLPFETLIAQRPGPQTSSTQQRQYWLDVGPPLVYGPSATVLISRKKARDQQLARLRAGRSYRREAVLLGDPIFQREALPGAAAGDHKPAMVKRSRFLSRFGRLAPLPGTREEVRQIYRTLTQKAYQKASEDERVTVLLGEDATRTRLFEAAGGCRYLHLATHGLVDTSAEAIYSSLALTQPPVATPEDFGYLTLVDLFDYWWGRLGATELVVLSACDTQRGRLEGGEGVFGISLGFLYAGAPAVIASLWQVADKSTAEMMSGLYREISQQQAQGSKSAKLRAFVAVRKALRRKHPQPYFWAPFIYIGDPR